METNNELISIDNVATFLKNLKNKYTMTTNDIPLVLWKHLHEIISPILAHIINTSFKQLHFPNYLKISEITPIYKKGDHLNICNYRPISILPNLSKIFEKSLLHNIQIFLDTNDILPNSQYGFRKNRSTKDAILDLRLKLEETTNNSKKCCLIMLDMSKAFDKVNHHIMINKMNELNFPKDIILYTQSFLQNRKYCTKIDKSFSKFYNCTSGVPQGSILSPTLYSIYVYDFENYINEYTLSLIHI